MTADYILVGLGAVIGGAVVLGCELAWRAYRAERRVARFADVDALARGGRS